MQSGGAGPLWLDVLLAAQDWGVPPWAIANPARGATGGEAWIWLTRWQKLSEQLAKRREREERELRRGR